MKIILRIIQFTLCIATIIAIYSRCHLIPVKDDHQRELNAYTERIITHTDTVPKTMLIPINFPLQEDDIICPFLSHDNIPIFVSLSKKMYLGGHLQFTLTDRTSYDLNRKQIVMSNTKYNELSELNVIAKIEGKTIIVIGGKLYEMNFEKSRPSFQNSKGQEETFKKFKLKSFDLITLPNDNPAENDDIICSARHQDGEKVWECVSIFGETRYTEQKTFKMIPLVPKQTYKRIVLREARDVELPSKEIRTEDYQKNITIARRIIQSIQSIQSGFTYRIDYDFTHSTETTDFHIFKLTLRYYY